MNLHKNPAAKGTINETDIIFSTQLIFGSAYVIFNVTESKEQHLAFQSKQMSQPEIILLFIHSDPEYLDVCTPITKLYSMHNTQSFMTPFNQALERETRKICHISTWSIFIWTKYKKEAQIILLPLAFSPVNNIKSLNLKNNIHEKQFVIFT